MSLLLRVVMLVEHAWTVDQKVVESSFRNTQNIEAELGTDGEHTVVGGYAIGLAIKMHSVGVSLRRNAQEPDEI